MMYQTRLWVYEVLLLLFAPLLYVVFRRTCQYGPVIIKWIWPTDLGEFLLTILKMILVSPRILIIRFQTALLALESFLRNAAEMIFIYVHFIILLPRRLLSVRAMDNPVIPKKWRSYLDNHPARTVILAAFIASLIPLSAAFFLGRLPLPDIHDEFCYFLTADTFSHGRITNPPHPYWQHFESIHLMHQPTYASKFPPAQGLFMALGQVLTDRPIIGIWISFVLMAAAICWALQAFFSPVWALFGTLICVLQTGATGHMYSAGFFGHWSQSYFGGAVPALGGALLFGSLRRLWDSPSIPLSFLLGLSLAILANSRPYEGFLISIPVAFILIFWFFRDKRFPWKIKIVRVFFPLIVVLSLAASWMTYYNWRVTGSPLKLPFHHYDRIYAVIPDFGWQASRPTPNYNHPFIRKFTLDHDDNEYKRDSAVNIFRQRIRAWFSYYLNFPLVISLLGLGVVLRSFWMKFFSIEILIAWVGILMASRREMPHHTAPTIAAVYILAIAGLQYVRRWEWGKIPLGKIIVISIFSTYLLLACVILPMNKWTYEPLKRHNPEFRAGIMELLRRDGRRHVIIVRYKPDIDVDETLFNWVYNDADIDNSPVVWAMDMDEQKNDALLDYFQSREKWLLNANTEVPFLLPYKFNQTYQNYVTAPKGNNGERKTKAIHLNNR